MKECKKVKQFVTYIDYNFCPPKRRLKTRIVVDACGNRKRVPVYQIGGFTEPL